MRNTGTTSIPDQGCEVRVTNSSLGGSVDSAWNDYPTIPIGGTAGAVSPWHITGNRIPCTFTGWVTADVTIRCDGQEETLDDYQLFEVVPPDGDGGGQADLQGTSFSVLDDPANAGDDVDITYDIRNSGTDASGPFRVKWYLSTNSTIAASDRELEEAVFPSIAAGDSTGTIERTVTLPATGDSFWGVDGTYYIGMILDTDNNVDESNETNNRNRGNGLDRDSVYVQTASCVPPEACFGPVCVDDISWQDEPGEGHGSSTVPNSCDFGNFNIYLRNTTGSSVPDQGCRARVTNVNLSSSIREGYEDYPTIPAGQARAAVTPWHLTGDRIPCSFTGCVTGDVAIWCEGYGEQTFSDYPLFEVLP